MTVELLTERHLVCLSLKEAAQARLNLHLSKCHIVGNHMSRRILALSPNSSTGRASTFEGEGLVFESRLHLTKGLKMVLAAPLLTHA